tara:strand:- start:365 stop:481 length:117 start_codon:yes stop_codon:yes gene_type:complete
MLIYKDIPENSGEFTREKIKNDNNYEVLNNYYSEDIKR